MKRALLSVVLLLFLLSTVVAQTPRPVITNFNTFGPQRNVRFPQSPAIKAYTILTTTNLNLPFTADTNFAFSPYYSTNTILVPSGEIVIDNPSATFVGTWSTGTGSTDKYGLDYRYRNQGNGGSHAQFTPTIATAGAYDVYAWHPQGTNRTVGAPHVVTHAAGSTTVYVNQQVNGGKWNLLGRFNFNTGTGGHVRITDGFSDAGNVVLVDAIRFSAVIPPPPVPTNVVSIAGYEWRTTNAAAQGYYQLEMTPLNTNEVLTATVLNRLAYGPTPDDLDRILTGQNPIGPEAYIAEQLAPETITEEVNNSHTNINIIEAKFAASDEPVTTNNAAITDLRAWHTLRAVGARRQLLEVLLQFFENHFVTQYSKSTTYFDGFYDNSPLLNRLATQWELEENRKWRAALLNPNCTFLDLLRISIESPAMIVYLDTVTSRGDGGRVANENYARELFELFTFGVDNGYDQTDIVECSKAWTGWRVEIVDPTNAFNPFAARTTNNLPGVTTNFAAVSNLLGCWVFNYKPIYHNNNSKRIFAGKYVPARFGVPYVRKLYGTNTVPGLYELFIPARSGTNAIQDGYDVIRHIANLPFTQEYLSVKLCQLFVHDEFHTGYDFTDAEISPEETLVRQCMTAWENSSGQIRPVLATIFNSALFRNQEAALHKVKTPLEYVVSVVRSMRASRDGSFTPDNFTADTDGYTLNTPLTRMGGMLLFDRADPDGYPESAPGWISAGTIAERIRFTQSFCIAPGSSGHNGGQGGTGNDAGLLSYCYPADLIKTKLPSSEWNNAAAVADCFLGIFFPGEGSGNLQLYKQAAVSFLNTSDSGASSPFSSLAPTGLSYDTRVRGMAAMLLMMQRFQEQ